MVFITGLMGVFGVVSYFAFGSETASIITLNLGDPTQDSVVCLVWEQRLSIYLLLMTLHYMILGGRLHQAGVLLGNSFHLPSNGVPCCQGNTIRITFSISISYTCPSCHRDLKQVNVGLLLFLMYIYIYI